MVVNSKFGPRCKFYATLVTFSSSLGFALTYHELDRMYRGDAARRLVRLLLPCHMHHSFFVCWFQVTIPSPDMYIVYVTSTAQRYSTRGKRVMTEWNRDPFLFGQCIP